MSWSKISSEKFPCSNFEFFVGFGKFHFKFWCSFEIVLKKIIWNVCHSSHRCLRDVCLLIKNTAQNISKKNSNIPASHSFTASNKSTPNKTPGKIIAKISKYVLNPKQSFWGPLWVLTPMKSKQFTQIGDWWRIFLP